MICECTCLCMDENLTLRLSGEIVWPHFEAVIPVKTSEIVIGCESVLLPFIGGYCQSKR